MKIVINENKTGDLREGVIFEADIFHSTMNPKISFWDNTDGSVTLNLHLWDSEEINDGYTTQQAEEMVATLTCAINFAKHIIVKKDDSQLYLFDVGE